MFFKQIIVGFTLAAGLITSLLQAEPPAEKTCDLFSYFKNNRADGLHLAYSHDGLNWLALKNDQPFLAPAVGGKLMRDPSIARGPDGVYHMVWSSGW